MKDNTINNDDLNESKKSVDELDRDILVITSKIQKEYPELMKYLEEIPTNFSATNSEGVNRDNLLDYYNTLNELLKSYSKGH